MVGRWIWSPPAPRKILRNRGRLVGKITRSPYGYVVLLRPPRKYHAAVSTAISLETIQAHKFTVSTWVHCVASRPVSALSTMAGVVPIIARAKGSSVCFPTTDQATSPKAAVTSLWIALKYKKKRFSCGLWSVLGLFFDGSICIFEYRKTPRFDARQKIAVRSGVTRNGSLTRNYLNLPPTKPAVGKRSPPRHRAWACAFYFICTCTISTNIQVYHYLARCYRRYLYFV